MGGSEFGLFMKTSYLMSLGHWWCNGVGVFSWQTFGPFSIDTVFKLVS